jgi:AcrR family transcriptional regulator
MTSTAAVADPADTKDRLLDAAEKAIADIGPEAMSLRRVTEDAGCNVAAVHYHFGNKLALVRAALARRLAVQTERQLELLAEFDDDSSISDLVRVLVTPLVALTYAEGQQRFVQFLRMLEHAGGQWREAILETGQPIANQLEIEYGRLLPHLRVETVIARGQVGRVMMFEILANPERFYGYEPTPDEVTETLVDLVVAALTVPDASRGRKTDLSAKVRRRRGRSQQPGSSCFRDTGN